MVDYFIVVEARRTHTNLPKPLHVVEALRRREPRFVPFMRKILTVVVDSFPEGSSPLECEIIQRNAITRGVADAAPEDWLLIGDVDEIPRRDKVALLRRQVQAQRMRPIYFRADFYYYSFRWWHDEVWHAPAAVMVKDMIGEGKLTAHNARVPYARGMPSVLAKGSWHMSFFGGPDAIIEKIKTYSHQEYNTKQLTAREYVEQMIEQGEDVLQRAKRGLEPPKLVRIDNCTADIPAHILEHRERLGYMIPC